MEPLQTRLLLKNGLPEVWVPIQGYAGRYEISNKRRVRKCCGKILKIYSNPYGGFDYVKIKINTLDDVRTINLDIGGALQMSAPETTIDGIIWPV
jgi:hypothetical protein